MPGYALLPTVVDPTSRLTFRLSDTEMQERNKWIIDSAEQGMSIGEIAHEVGLSIIRVRQILGPPAKTKAKKKKKFKTPRDAAIANYEENHMHRGCVSLDFYHMCTPCFGGWMLVDSEYDTDGWPFQWAMHGQEEFIEASMPRRSTPRV